MKKILKILNILILLSIPVLISGAGAQTPTAYYIPGSEDSGINYYYTYGGPNISATIAGSNQFDKDETITLPIDLMNHGKYLGFEMDRTPTTPDETYAAQIQKLLETRIVDATGIVASLSVDPDSPLEVLSPAQQVGSINGGESTLSPAKFNIKIAKDAKAGEYNLYLNLTYEYQKYVLISYPNATAQTYDTSYRYSIMNQSQTLKLIVKTQADFEIVNTTGSLYPGTEGDIKIAIKNIGEEDARDARAIIDPSDPLSSTDDQAFLYDIKPGDTVVTDYKIAADSKAVPKTNGVNMVIRYENTDGDTVYSTTMQVPVIVKNIGLFQRLFGWI